MALDLQPWELAVLLSGVRPVSRVSGAGRPRAPTRAQPPPPPVLSGREGTGTPVLCGRGQNLGRWTPTQEPEEEQGGEEQGGEEPGAPLECRFFRVATRRRGNQCSLLAVPLV